MADFATGGRPSGSGLPRPILKAKSDHRRRPRPKCWLHQDELRAGREVIIQLVSDPQSNIVRGHIVEADQFTIKISLGTGDQRIYFKHAIEYIRPV